jgi:hypothetical protein
MWRHRRRGSVAQQAVAASGIGILVTGDGAVDGICIVMSGRQPQPCCWSFHDGGAGQWSSTKGTMAASSFLAFPLIRTSKENAFCVYEQKHVDGLSGYLFAKKTAEC